MLPVVDIVHFTMTPLPIRNLSLAAGALLLLGTAQAADSLLSRYPFDPACAWGRLGDGRGRAVRCLTEDEAKRLATATPTTPTAAAARPGPAPAGSVAPTPRPSATPTASAAPVPAPAPVASATPGITVGLEAELADLVVEEGDLPVARKKLALPKDRYLACVVENGGLLAAVGEVRVRFLVQERGRAEGATAESWKGVDEKAARCIADVIDRRPTGTPEAPMTAATAVVRVAKAKR
jgi:hypothetical protein